MLCESPSSSGLAAECYLDAQEHADPLDLKLKRNFLRALGEFLFYFPLSPLHSA